MVDRRLWEEFKSKVGSGKGLRMLSQAIEDELSDALIVEALRRMLKDEEAPPTISPVKPRAATDAGRAVREMRGSRAYTSIHPL